MPELYTNLGEVVETRNINETYVAVLLPHYFTEGQFIFGEPYTDGNGRVTETTPGRLSEWAGLMSYPVTRAGTTLGFLNDVYGISEREYRLTLDRQVVPVGYLNSTTTYRKYTTYKHSQAAEGQVIARIKPADLASLTAADYIKTPREMGWFMVAPEGVCQKARLTNSGSLGSAIVFNMLNTSYRCRAWENAASTAVTASTSALSDKSVSVNRAQNFIQRWVERLAVDESQNNGIHNALVLSISDAFTLDGNGHVNALTNIGKLDCETTGTLDANGMLGQTICGLKLINIEQAFYNRIQKLAFVISPFDSCKPAVFDPYSFAFMFNCAGFMESDYNEDVYNRVNQVQNQGWLYTKDPFVSDSIVFKDAIRYTEV
jgi:hypothetical protein